MTTSIEPSVSVDLPFFVRRALGVLPSFLEAIRAEPSDVTMIQFSPDSEKARAFPDPETGWVSFSLVSSESVRFSYVYQSGEEGTRGSLAKLVRIELERNGKNFYFFPVEHHCSCRICPGLKYPFCPGSMAKQPSAFQDGAEEDRLRFIREYLSSQ
jgi:hypothetical protein